jgi:hypothetical protein
VRQSRTVRGEECKIKMARKRPESTALRTCAQGTWATLSQDISVGRHGRDDTDRRSLEGPLRPDEDDWRTHPAAICSLPSALCTLLSALCSPMLQPGPFCITFSLSQAFANCFRTKLITDDDGSHPTNPFHLPNDPSRDKSLSQSYQLLSFTFTSLGALCHLPSLASFRRSLP